MTGGPRTAVGGGAIGGHVGGPRPVPPGSGGSAAEVVDRARTRIATGQRAVVELLAPTLRHMAGYHFGWWDERGEPTSSAGKALRPALALTCAAAAGGPGAVGDLAVDAAIAVELIHDFSLIHDDVMDGDTLRRGRPAVWSVFGQGQAILLGDALLTLATGLFDDRPAAGPLASALTGAILELYAGQSADLAFEHRREVTLAHTLAMAEGKTGALLGASCEIGALAGGADSASAGVYRAFGRTLGIAFQLVDDLLGIWGVPDTTGKPQTSDLYARKKSLPVVKALTSPTPAGRALRARYESAAEFDADDVAELADLIDRAGGRTWARAEADRRLDQALGLLDRVRTDPAAVADLHTIARALVERER